MAQNRSQTQSKSQSQVLAQVRKQLRGDAFDELDLDTGIELPVGSEVIAADQDFDDEQDFDLQLETKGDAESEFDVKRDDGNEFDMRSLVHRITGQRQPKVSFRLSVADDEITVVSLVATNGTAQEEAVDEICETIQLIFQIARDELDGSSWEKLIGVEQASVEARLYLLANVQMNFGEPLSFGEQGKFKPNDRTFARYASKFMLLPDGLPITLRLLFREGRGASKSAELDLRDIPDSVLVPAVRQTLAREAANGKAEDDASLSFEIRATVSDMIGFVLPSNTRSPREVQRVRDKFKRHGIEHELPNRATRQRDYDLASAEASEGNQ